MTNDAQAVQQEGWNGSLGSETQSHGGELKKGKKRAGSPPQLITCQECSKQFLKPWNQITRSRFHFCSASCRNRNKECCKYAGEQCGNVQRFGGSGKSYVKFLGRHAHRIAAEHKLGRPLQRGEIVHHINGNRRDNRHENLEVMTQSEHIKIHLPEMHALKAKSNSAARGVGHGMSKLKPDDIVKIRRLVSEGIMDTEISRQFNVSATSIYAVRKGKTWKHVP